MTDEMKTKMLGLAKIANINGAIEESTFIMGFIEAVELIETREKILVEALEKIIQPNSFHTGDASRIIIAQDAIKKLGHT